MEIQGGLAQGDFGRAWRDVGKIGDFFMLKQRVLTAVLGIPLMVIVAYYGGIVFQLAIILVQLVGLQEFFNFASPTIHSQYTRVAFSIILIIYSIFFVGHEAQLGLFFLALLLTPVLFGVEEIVGLALAFWGITYVGLLSFLVALRGLPQGFELVLWVFSVMWANDTAAYFIGKKWGHKKLVPRISPNKSWAGALGGCALALATAVGLNYFFHLFELKQLIGAAFIVIVAGQWGDIVESALKRNAGVKDSGTILPGHGGILDRFDGLILASPAIYWYISWLARI